MAEEAKSRTCQYELDGRRICKEPVEDGQEFCVCHRSERTPEELDRFREIVRERMKGDGKHGYDFRGFLFPEGFQFDKDSAGRLVFHGDADFNDATFEGDAGFWRATFEGDADFIGATFEGGALFTNAQFDGDAYFDGMSIGKGVDLRVKRFDGDVGFDEVAAPPAGRFHAAKGMRKERRIAPGKGESFCRLAKQTYQNMGRYREAGDYFYEECCHAWHHRAFLESKGLKRILRFLNPILTIGLLLEFIFGRLIFGYGERPGRIALISCLLVGLFAWAYDASEAIVHSSGEVLSGYWDSLYFSAVTFTTLGFGDYAPMYGNPIARLAAFEAFAGAFLIAAFIVTLARRWGRG
jgi:hypothetical protein